MASQHLDPPHLDQPPPPNLVARLRAAGCVFAEDEAVLLLAGAASHAELERLVADRVRGLPLEQLLGWAEFGGRRVLVEPGVFVPRRRTELMARLALDLLGPGSVAVDLCCGTGALAAVLLDGLPGLEVYAADLDPAAVHCAGRNLSPDRVFAGDLYDALPRALLGSVDVIVANAPYVPTEAIALMPPEARDHEHRITLDGGADGLDVQRRVVAGAPAWLAPGGTVLVESGSGQVEASAASMRAAGLSVRVELDEEIGAVVVAGLLTPGSP